VRECSSREQDWDWGKIMGKMVEPHSLLNIMLLSIVRLTRITSMPVTISHGQYFIATLKLTERLVAGTGSHSNGCCL
jgi:hypothetical protein